MLKLGIIEESLEHSETLKSIQYGLFSQRTEEVPEDEYPLWHVNEYHIPDESIPDVLELLKEEVKFTWYIHAFDDKHLYVILRGRYFVLPFEKDESWDGMIEYGTKKCHVEKYYLEDIKANI